MSDLLGVAGRIDPVDGELARPGLGVGRAREGRGSRMFRAISWSKVALMSFTARDAPHGLVSVIQDRSFGLLLNRTRIRLTPR